MQTTNGCHWYYVLDFLTEIGCVANESFAADWVNDDAIKSRKLMFLFQMCQLVCVGVCPCISVCICVCQLQALDAVIRILTTETSQRFIFDISALVKQQQQNIREKLFR